MDKKVREIGWGGAIAYTCGQVGYPIMAFGMTDLMNYYFNSSVTNGERMFPTLLTSVIVLSIASALGVIWDAITDPILANMNDHSKNPLVARFGRRKSFMMMGIIPAVLIGVLCYVVPSAPASMFNNVWVVASRLLFFLFMTMYWIPYVALQIDLGHSVKSRMRLAMLSGIGYTVGYMIANMFYTYQAMLEKTFAMSSVTAFKTLIAIYAVVGGIFLLIPIVFINEKECSYPVIVNEKMGLGATLKEAFSNKNFVAFGLSGALFFTCFYLAQASASYQILMTLGLDASYVSVLIIGSYCGGLLFYKPAQIFCEKFGAKATLIGGLLVYGLAALYRMTWGTAINPFSPVVSVWIATVIMAIPSGLFNFIFYAITGDLAEVDYYETGNNKKALYAGARGFITKAGTAIATGIMPFIIVIGSMNQEPTLTGITVVMGVTVLVAVLSALAMSRYDQKHISEVLEKIEAERTASKA